MKQKRIIFKRILILVLLLNIFSFFNIYDTYATNIKIDECISMISNNINTNMGSVNKWDFSYTGRVQQWTVPRSGRYKITVKGAGGGRILATGGATISGFIDVTKGSTYYIAVGGNGTSSLGNGAQGGWNGGGSSSGYGGSGGGATAVYNSLIGDGQLFNYQNNKNNILIVAGGGGGTYYDTSFYDSTQYISGGYYDTEILGTHEPYEINSTVMVIATAYHQRKLDHLCGYGGYNEGQGSYYIGTGENTTIKPGYNTGATRNSGFAFGKGQDSIGNYTGAGGGGYYGGFSVDTTKYEVSTGGGGSGYYNESFIKDLSFTNNPYTSSGVSIEYVPQVTTLKVMLEGHATYNGSAQDVEISGDIGDTFNLSNIVANNGVTISSFQVEFGDGYIDSNNVYHFNKKDTVIRLNCQSKVSFMEKIYEGVLFLEANASDNQNKKYKLYASINNNQYRQLDEREYNFAATESKRFEYTGNVQEYVVKFPGFYKLVVAGGGGTSEPGYSTKGSVASGTVFLDKDTKLYAYVGGREQLFNGGGKGGGRSANPYPTYLYSTNGSGASDFRLVKSTASDKWSGETSLRSRIITAGGGGGKRVCVGRAFQGAYATNSYFDETSRLYGIYGVNSELSNGVLGKGSDEVYSTSVFTDSGDRGYSNSRWRWRRLVWWSNKRV